MHRNGTCRGAKRPPVLQRGAASNLSVSPKDPATCAVCIVHACRRTGFLVMLRLAQGGKELRVRVRRWFGNFSSLGCRSLVMHHAVCREHQVPWRARAWCWRPLELFTNGPVAFPSQGSTEYHGVRLRPAHSTGRNPPGCSVPTLAAITPNPSLGTCN